MPEQKIQVLTTKELDSTKVSDINLPSPGHLKDEELRRRTDNLQQAIDENSFDTGKIPDKLLEPDREILYDITQGYMQIGKNRPEYVTKWVNYVNQNGSKVWQEKAQGWQVATTREFPEGEHLKREDRTLRVGDVLLMFIKKDLHENILKRQEERKRAQLFGVESEVRAFAAKHSNIFTDVSSEFNGNMPAHISNRMHAKATARKVAAQHLGNRMKSGLVEGLPIK